MPDVLQVRLNEDGPQSIAAPQSFETTADFDVVLENTGTALHVHVRLDPTLSGVARVTTPNRYVEGGSTRKVRVEVDDGARPIEGRLEVVTGYGATTEYVSVVIRDPAIVNPSVTVDERLGRPQQPANESTIDPNRLLIASIVAVAALLAITAALLTRDIVATAGVVFVLVALGVSGFLLME